MKYVFLAYNDEACVANDKALRASGHLLNVAGLQNSRTATTEPVYDLQCNLTRRSCDRRSERGERLLRASACSHTDKRKS